MNNLKRVRKVIDYFSTPFFQLSSCGSKIYPSLPSSNTDSSRDSIAINNTYNFTSIGIANTIFKQSCCILILPTVICNHTQLELRHHTKHSTAFTNYTVQLENVTHFNIILTYSFCALSQFHVHKNVAATACMLI